MLKVLKDTYTFLKVLEELKHNERIADLFENKQNSKGGEVPGGEGHGDPKNSLNQKKLPRTTN